MLRGNLSSKALYEFLIFGNPHFNNISNKLFLGATISFVLSTERIELAYENTSCVLPIICVYTVVLF